MRQDIRLAGFGGQGIILAGYLLGKAAGLYADREAVFTQSYGPEARGGACAAQVSVSAEPIEYPHFDKADTLVVMSQEAWTKYADTARPGAMIIIDEDLVDPGRTAGDIRRAPFTRIAEELGNRIVANITMLGYLTALSDLLTRPAVEEAIRTEVKERFIDLNLEAFARGYACARQPEVVS
jgi:2-oxoglutarate ferredoxin oxidoreductase subunit gamma